MNAKVGPGHFQWNTGAWFGAQFGATCWMLCAGAWLLWYGKASASVLAFACFLVPNLIGSFLWCRRDKLFPIRAYGMLLTVMGLFATGALASVNELGGPLILEKVNRGQRISYWWLLLYSGLLLYFWFLEAEARRRKASKP